MKRLLLLLLFLTPAALPGQRDTDDQRPERDERRPPAPRFEPEGPRPGTERARGRRPAPPPWARRGAQRPEAPPMRPRTQQRPLPFDRRQPGADGPPHGRDVPWARRGEPGPRDEAGQGRRPDRAALRERLLRARLHRLERRLHELERDAGRAGRRDRVRGASPPDRAERAWAEFRDRGAWASLPG